MKYTKTVFFYLNDKELALLDKKAKSAGLNRSEYLRKNLQEAEMRAELEDFLNKNSEPLYRCENMTITGKGKLKQRIHDSVDVYGNKKTSYDFIKSENGKDTEG